MFTTLDGEWGLMKAEHADVEYYGGGRGNPLICTPRIRQARQSKERPAITRIARLDLTDVKAKLCFPESRGGKGWTPSQADIVEKLYKEYLQECLTKEDCSPDSDVDDMWHTHILFTKQYAQDCKKVFGYFLHHVPNLDIKESTKCWNNCSCNNGCGHGCKKAI